MKNKGDLFKLLYENLKSMFKQESFNSTFTRHCRVVTLDGQMSLRVKTYSLLWLQEYASVNKKLVRRYFEKDIKLL